MNALKKADDPAVEQRVRLLVRAQRVDRWAEMRREGSYGRRRLESHAAALRAEEQELARVWREGRDE